MKSNAKTRLDPPRITCALVAADGTCYHSGGRGIIPLLTLLNSVGELARGASAADTVVGKAAATLWCDAGIRELYADAISKPALSLLNSYDISVEYGELAEYIINREGTGACPLEKAVENCTSLEQGKKAIGEFVAKLKKI